MYQIKKDAYYQFEKEMINYFNVNYNNCENGLMVDGVLDFELYNKSNPKVLWVLKEAYYGENQIKYYSKYAKEYFDFEEKILPTAPNLLKRMMYINYGIANEQCLNWNGMDNYDENEEVYNAFKTAAIINLKKIPGSKLSNMSEIAAYFNRDKELIKKQINLLNPNIIIFGNTYNIVKDELEIAQFENQIEDIGYVKEGKLYINAYHPSYFVMPEQTYVDSILNIVNKFLNKPNNN